MKQLKENSFGEICLITVFAIGDLIIAFPKGYGSRYGLWGFLMCAALAAAVTVLYVKIQCSSPAFCTTSLFKPYKNNVLNTVFVVVFTVFVFLCFSECTKDYIHMVDEVRLKNTPNWVIAAIFTGVVILVGNLPKNTVYKFAIPAALFTGIGVVFMLLLSLNSAKPELMTQAFAFDAGESVKQMVSFYIHSFGQIAAVLFFIGGKNKRRSQRIQFGGVLCGTAIFLICLVNTVLLIGVNVINNVSYPYATATAIINFGGDYTRLDVITYYIFFSASLVKSVVLYKAATEAVNSINSTAAKIIKFVFPVMGFAVSASHTLSSVMDSNAVNLVIIALQILLPAALLLSVHKQSSRRS